MPAYTVHGDMVVEVGECPDCGHALHPGYACDTTAICPRIESSPDGDFVACPTPVHLCGCRSNLHLVPVLESVFA